MPHLPRALFVVCLAATAATAAFAVAPVVIEHHVALHVEALIVDGDTTRAAGRPVDLEIGPEDPGVAMMTVPWGSREKQAEVRLNARLLAAPADTAAVVRFSVVVTVPGKPESRSERDLQVNDEGTELFDVFVEKHRRLLLTIRGERVDRAVVLRAAHVGDPVRFLVAIERVDGERTVLLETNQLNTFVGQSVQYSFRRGADAELESVTLDLLPVSVAGDIVTLQADVSGALPGPQGTTLVSQHQRIVASRRATSSLAATAGTPPAGYRFQVTPDF